MIIAKLRSRLPQTWTDFARYLRHSEYIQPIGLRAGWRIWLAMLGLDTLGLILLTPALALWQWLSGTGGPKAFQQFPEQWLFVSAAFVAPVLVEALFRGPLSGRPRALWLLGCTVAFSTAFALLAPHAADAAALLGLVLVAALGGWLALRRTPTAQSFAHHFAWFFYASALLFGLVHTFNYGTPQLKLVPLVLPQLWSGLTLGYTRMRVGLPASMLLHAGANALALGLIAAGI